MSAQPEQQTPAPVVLAATKPKPPPEMSWAWYVGHAKVPSSDLDSALAASRNGMGFVWIGLHNPTELTMARLGQKVDLHELAIEDAVHGHRRSKLERFDETLFMVVSTVDYVERGSHANASEIVTTGELMIFLGQHFVMTSRHSGQSRLADVRTLVERSSDDLPEGPSRVLYAALAVAIEDMARVATQMEEDVEDAEEMVFATEVPDVERPYQIKRELIQFRRCVAPLCGPLAALAQREYGVIPPEARPYFRDLSDQVQQTREAIGAMEDQLTNILQAAIARSSVADNRDMRKISAAVALLAVPTTISAVYGQNFENMPELRWEYGYFLVMGLNVVLMLTLYLLFRKFKWL
ncbi:MAG: magnesium and cobalt transport protein CorA [Micropruina sp.]|nr:magnesium and cobalt transport protein CorA [Micropruina sp.]